MAKFSRKRVWERAGGKCEYCQLAQADSVLPHELDHIRAKKHHGRTTLANTCLACAYCNAAKGSNVAGYDPTTDELVPLFHPRADRWTDHFEWDGPILVGITPTGRVTIDVLRINEVRRVEHRRLLKAMRPRK
jgi:HNH endonuclease